MILGVKGGLVVKSQNLPSIQPAVSGVRLITLRGRQEAKIQQSREEAQAIITRRKEIPGDMAVLKLILLRKEAELKASSSQKALRQEILESESELSSFQQSLAHSESLYSHAVTFTLPAPVRVILTALEHGIIRSHPKTVDVFICPSPGIAGAVEAFLGEC